MAHAKTAIIVGYLLPTNETKKLTFLSELLLKPVATFAQIP